MVVGTTSTPTELAQNSRFSLALSEGIYEQAVETPPPSPSPGAYGKLSMDPLNASNGEPAENTIIYPWLGSQPPLASSVERPFCGVPTTVCGCQFAYLSTPERRCIGVPG